MAPKATFLTRGSVLPELRGQGKGAENEGKRLSAMSVLCALEVISASGAIPFRVRGNVMSLLQRRRPSRNHCMPLLPEHLRPFGKGKYDFLSGLVIPHGCDSMVRSFSTWSYSLPYSYFHFVNIPTSVRVFLRILQRRDKHLQKKSGGFAGKAITGCGFERSHPSP